MSDGRAFTDYHANCQLNKMIQEKYELKNSHDYRLYLQHNAEEIMKVLSKCEVKEDCAVCPVCKMALEYKP